MSETGRRWQLLLALTLILVLLLPGGSTALAWSGQPLPEVATLDGQGRAQIPSAQAMPTEDSAPREATWAAARLPDEIANVPGVTGDWWAAVQEQIRRDTYVLAEEMDGGGVSSYRGQNPAHGFALTFAADGVRLAPARERAGAGTEGMWRWHLRFTAYGYEGQVQPIGGPVSTGPARCSVMV